LTRLLNSIIRFSLTPDSLTAALYSKAIFRNREVSADRKPHVFLMISFYGK
jgi:hypothetical protein